MFFAESRFRPLSAFSIFFNFYVLRSKENGASSLVLYRGPSYCLVMFVLFRMMMTDLTAMVAVEHTELLGNFGIFCWFIDPMVVKVN